LLGHALHLGGIVDRMIAILVVPGRVEAATRFDECVAGLGGASARSVKRLGQVGNLGRATNLQALIDRPWVPAGLRDEQRDAYIAELYRHRQPCP
jgi:hypothetical protein